MKFSVCTIAIVNARFGSGVESSREYPLLLRAFQNGAAISVFHAMQDEHLPMPIDNGVLVEPSADIGVTRPKSR